jgi:general secretion pathway protein G
MCSSRQSGTQRAASKTGTRPPQARRTRGFSFIEIMVVVVIIGLLAGAVALKVGDYMDTAKTNRARSDLATIVDAVEAYQLKNGRYPANEEGLDKLPLKNCTDPWGHPYEYNSPAQNEPYEVVSYGADGRKGGDGVNADLYSWQLDSKKGGK